jgi:hypothetical protein
MLGDLGLVETLLAESRDSVTLFFDELVIRYRPSLWLGRSREGGASQLTTRTGRCVALSL